MAKASTKSKGTNKTMTTEATTKTPMTLDEKIAMYENLVAKLKARRNSLAQINNVQVGDQGVTFNFGRGEKARVETGNVIAVGDSAQGKLVVIQTGEGLEIAQRKVRAADIISNPSADARNAEGGEAAADAGDPLAAA